MKHATGWIGALLLAGCAGPDHAPPRAGRPHVLLICVDDLKPVAGCYGGEAKTPAIDRLAARGVRFERAYCNQAVCAPSRNALLSGLRPTTTGIYDLGTNFRAATPGAVTLPQHFKANGYLAESVGKVFHFGHGNRDDSASWSSPAMKGEVVKYLRPESRGGGELTREEALFSNRPAAGLPRGAAFEAPDVPDSAYPDGAIGDEAIRRLKAAQGPLFLAVGFVKPHLPFCAPKRYWDLYDPASFRLPELRKPPEGAPAYAPTAWGELRNYAETPEKGPLTEEQARRVIHGYHAAASYADAQVGRLLDALEQGGLAQHTVVVLWGDHGWHLGDHGLWGKHTNYEQAARIPLIVAGPGVKAGGASTAMAESVDVYPTLCGLAGLAVPAGLDGVGLEAQLRDPAAPGKDAVLHAFPRGPRIGRALRTARHRLVEWKIPGAAPETADLELYDYEADPAESRNLAKEQPDLVGELRARLDRFGEAKPPLRR